jgi:hypothetical protein
MKCLCQSADTGILFLNGALAMSAEVMEGLGNIEGLH